MAACGVLWYVVTSILIYDNLRRRGRRVSLLWLRMMLPWYASEYRRITRTETGRVGSLFYHWTVSINLALVLMMLALVIHYF